MDLSAYSSNEYTGFQLHEIRLGLEHEEKSGKDLPPLKGNDITLRPDNVTYVSKKDGYVLFNEEKYTVDIQDVLVINGNVNRLYGNVFYDGTVRVNGNVGEDTIISAKGDVIVNGYIQSSFISAGHKVVAVGGINANDTGYISAQDGVFAEYIENANVYAGGNVEANYILNSTIEAGDEIPLSAQIVSIADVYDSLLSKRVYKNAYDPQKAYTMIMNGECGAFSSTILDCLSKSREKLEALYVAVPQQ